MSFLREVLEGTARKDLKNRVEETLEASRDLKKSIDRLSDMFESLSDGGENSRLISLLGGMREDMKKGLTDIRQQHEQLIAAIEGRHFRSIEKLLKFIDKHD